MANPRPVGNKTGKGGFKKGADPRRSNSGQRNAVAVSFAKQIRQIIVEVGEEEITAGGRAISRIEGAVRGMYNQATKGNVQAFTALVERVEGKVSQPVDGEFKGSIEVILREVVNGSHATD